MRNRTYFGKILQKLDFGEDLPDQPLGRCGIIEVDVIRKLSQIFESRLGPNQSSHRDILTNGHDR